MTRNFLMIRVLGRPAIRVISWQCRSLAGWHHDSVPLAVSDLRLQVHKSIQISLPNLSAEYEGSARSEGDHESLARGRAAAAAAAARAALGGRRTSDSARVPPAGRRTRSHGHGSRHSGGSSEQQSEKTARTRNRTVTVKVASCISSPGRERQASEQQTRVTVGRPARAPASCYGSSGGSSEQQTEKTARTRTRTVTKASCVTGPGTPGPGGRDHHDSRPTPDGPKLKKTFLEYNSSNLFALAEFWKA